MNTKAELAPKLRGSKLGVSSLMLVNMRLKKLRGERHLVQRAILALTEISRARESRDRRAGRN